MIERYTIKFAPAVSQKELEKKLLDETAALTNDDLKKLRRMHARIEVTGDPEDLKRIAALLAELCPTHHHEAA